MPIASVHSTGLIVFNEGGEEAAPIYLHGVSNVKVDSGHKEFSEVAAGAFQPSQVGTMQIKAVISFTVSDISVLMAAVGADGVLSIAAANPIGSVDLYWTELANVGTRGDAHFMATVNLGMFVVKSIKANTDGVATADCELHAIYDGTNEPIAYSDDETQPIASQLVELYTVGKCAINGATIDGVQSINIDFNNDVVHEYAGGEVYSTHVYLKEQKPRIDIVSKTVQSQSTYGIGGTAQGGTASAVYFQKLANSGTRVAAGTTAHVKFTINANQGRIFISDASANNGDSADTTISILPSVGAAAILTVGTGVAIS